jgi:hypothetical protein
MFLINFEAARRRQILCVCWPHQTVVETEQKFFFIRGRQSGGFFMLPRAFSHGKKVQSLFYENDYEIHYFTR